MDEQIRGEQVVVAANEAGERLDRLLAARTALSRSRLKALILDGAVAIGPRTVRDPGYRVNAADVIAVDVPPPEPAQPAAERIPLNVVYEDADIIVIDKPAGLVVHPAAGHASGTLVNALIAHCGESLSGIGGVKRPGIVHRLDKDTSGLMVVAKNDAAHQSLAAQFADHGRTGPLERGYLAFAWGAFDRPKGTIEAPIARHPAKPHQDGGARQRARSRYALADAGDVSGSKRQAGREPGVLPPDHRADPPDPGPPRPCRASPPWRRHLRDRLQDQGGPARRPGPGGPGGPWKTGAPCLSIGHRTPKAGEEAGVPVGTAGRVGLSTSRVT